MTQVKITPINIGSIAADSQGAHSIGIGDGAGGTSQATNATAIGWGAGQTSQAAKAIAIGPAAGQTSQAGSAIAIGDTAGITSQGTFAVAIGSAAGNTSQATDGVAIGRSAGNSGQGANAIAIGRLAGSTSQTAGSIVLNASGSALEAAAAGFYVSAVRSAAGTTPVVMAFDTTNKEVIAWTGSPSATTATVITSNATPTTLYSATLGAGEVVTISGSINAAKDDYTDTTGGTFTVTARSTDGATAILAGTPYSVVNATSTATFSAVVSGADLIVQVTGIAATTYNWFMNATVQSN